MDELQRYRAWPLQYLAANERTSKCRPTKASMPPWHLSMPNKCPCWVSRLAIALLSRACTSPKQVRSHKKKPLIELPHGPIYLLRRLRNRCTRNPRAVSFCTKPVTGKVHGHLPGSRRAAPVRGLPGTGSALAADWPGAGC